MIQPPQRLLQLARLVGVDVFTERLGAPQTVDPDAETLRALVSERLTEVVRRLVEEAAASDDVVDGASAGVYLEDRLRTLGDLLTPQQADRIRALLRDSTAGW